MKITGTFLDEISHDIPHQNWSKKEWEKDFNHMKSIGIDTVILIRCGYKKQLTYPSAYLIENEDCHKPYNDLLRLFLELAASHNMSFYFGLYDSGKYWWELGDFKKELDINKYVIDEVWEKYGHYPAFKGWYISHEISRKTRGVTNLYTSISRHCKNISGGLDVMISPYIEGTKAIISSNPALTKQNSLDVGQHEKEWNDIFKEIHEVIDIVAFQDGHVELSLLAHYLDINKKLADKYHLTSWTNAESFDRDMPIKFLPIKWDKLRRKLESAKLAGIDKAITFEFSHFMSPQSCYPQAHNLYNRYTEWCESDTDISPVKIR